MNIPGLDLGKRFWQTVGKRQIKQVLAKTKILPKPLKYYKKMFLAKCWAENLWFWFRQTPLAKRVILFAKTKNCLKFCQKHFVCQKLFLIFMEIDAVFGWSKYLLWNVYIYTNKFQEISSLNKKRKNTKKKQGLYSWGDSSFLVSIYIYLL